MYKMDQNTIDKIHLFVKMILENHNSVLMLEIIRLDGVEVVTTEDGNVLSRLKLLDISWNGMGLEEDADGSVPSMGSVLMVAVVVVVVVVGVF